MRAAATLPLARRCRWTWAFLASVVGDYEDMGKPVTGGAPAGLVVQTWPQPLRRVVGNLVDNALRYAGAAEIEAGAIRPEGCGSAFLTVAPAFPRTSCRQCWHRSTGWRARATAIPEDRSGTGHRGAAGAVAGWFAEVAQPRGWRAAGGTAAAGLSCPALCSSKDASASALAVSASPVMKPSACTQSTADDRHFTPSMPRCAEPAQPGPRLLKANTQ